VERPWTISPRCERNGLLDVITRSEYGMGSRSAEAPVRTDVPFPSADHFRPLRGRRVGLVCHPASVDAQLRHTADLIAETPDVELAALFGPEHGFAGTAQDLIGVGHFAEGALRVHSLYGSSFESLKPTAEQLRGLDALVIDLQDVGSRYYTFQATMLYCLEACRDNGATAIVLDRPNPLGGSAVEGPALRAGFESFVGPRNVPTRHGMTMGELAVMYAKPAMQGLDLEVVAMEKWDRASYFDRTGLPWVMPSPNMPTCDTALVYPGMCLVEGTELSEGRGTTRPFELTGAPFLDGYAVADELAKAELPGLRVRPCVITPTFQKHAGKACGAIQLHVTDARAFRPYLTGVAYLWAVRRVHGDAMQWRRRAYEFVDQIPAIDLLCGTAKIREGIDAGASLQDLAATWRAEEDAWRQQRRAWLLYA
jgi:uncharacterized protein YbbC (DUF1343 family)